MSPKILIIPYVAVLVFLASITWIALPNYEDMAQLLSLARKGLAASQPYDHTAEIERMAEAICKEFREQPDGAQVWVENGGIRQETFLARNSRAVKAALAASTIPPRLAAADTLLCQIWRAPYAAERKKYCLDVSPELHSALHAYVWPIKDAITP